MQSFRMTSSNPYWFEDLVFAVVDETRRLPERASVAAAWTRRHANAGLAVLRRYGSALVTRPETAARPAKAARPDPVELARAPMREAELLDEPLAWALATEPLSSGEKSLRQVVELQDKAREQLGAITYVLDRMRDEIAPALTHPSNVRQSLAHRIEDVNELDTSIEALLALSQRNAAMRPKDRCLTAA